MTVTAVTVLWLPSGKVVVWRIVEVIELEDAPFGDAPAVVAAPEAPPADAAESLGDAGEPPFEGDSVTNPPPTVLMIVAPDPSIVVTTAPGDAEESLGDAGEPPLEGDSVTNPPPTVLMIVAPDTSIVVTTAPGDVTTPPGDVPAPADVAAGDELASLDWACELGWPWELGWPCEDAGVPLEATTVLAGRVLVIKTVVGATLLLAGAELAAWLLGLPWLDCGMGTGVCLSVLLLLGITGLTAELDGGTATVSVLVAGADVVFVGSALFAIEISLVAMAAFSWCTASMAVRSSLNTPCLNFVGE